MSWDDADKPFFSALPVFSGGKNRTLANRMLSALGGAESFRTRIHNNPDGSQTMLRTKGGFPQVITTRPPERIAYDVELFERDYNERVYTATGDPVWYNAGCAWPCLPYHPLHKVIMLDVDNTVVELNFAR